MAGKRLMKEIYEQFLVCKICFENYKQPKTLSCLHIFCTDCLEKHVEADYERTYRYLLYDRNIICPICRQKTDLPPGGVRRLPDSFLVANLTEVLHRRRMSAQIPSCQICKSRHSHHRQVATAKCLECNKLMCEDCVTLHRRTRVTRNHSLIEVGGEKDIECKVHQEEMVRFYCEPCEQCVCIVCMFHEHKGHEVSSFRDSIERHQNSLDDLLETCKDRLYVLKEHLDLISKCEKAIRNSEINIRDSAIETIASIRQREREMVSDLHDIYGEDTMQFIKSKDALQEMVSTMTSTCNVTEVIVRNKGIELLLLKREIKDKLNLLLQQSMQTPPINSNLQVYFVPGNVIFGHLSVNGMGMEVPAEAGAGGSPMITDTDAGCSASGPCCHVPQWNLRTDTGAAMTSSFTMTIEPEMYESQTMTDSVDVMKKKVQTEPLDVRDAGVETVRVMSSSVYTSMPEPLLCDRSTHTKQVSFTDKVTDTKGLVKYTDSYTGTDIINIKTVTTQNAQVETDKLVSTNKGTETDIHETADKIINTVKVPLYDQFTCTPHITMLDMETQARYYGDDKNVGTRAIVTEDLAIGDHNVFTMDQCCETGDDLIVGIPYRLNNFVEKIAKESSPASKTDRASSPVKFKDIIDNENKAFSEKPKDLRPMFIERASSPVVFDDITDTETEILIDRTGKDNVSMIVETESFPVGFKDTVHTEKSALFDMVVQAETYQLQPRGINCTLKSLTRPQCQEMEIQTDWTIEADLILPSTFPKVPIWENFGVPEQPELCVEIEHQHLVNCCCGPDEPMLFEESVDISKYKLIVPTEDVAMCTETQEVQNSYTDMGVEAEMENIMYAIASGWDSYHRRSSSASRRSSIVMKSCVDRSTNTPQHTLVDQETNTAQAQVEDRGTGTPQVITASKNMATTPVQTSNSSTGTFVPTVEKATYMVQPVYLSTGTSAPAPVTSNKKVNTPQVDTRDWSSMTTSVKTCDSETSMDISDTRPSRNTFTSMYDSTQGLKDPKTGKTILYTQDTSTMTFIETADVAILKRPHTLTRSVCTPKVRTAERHTSMEAPLSHNVYTMTAPVSFANEAPPDKVARLRNEYHRSQQTKVATVTRGTSTKVITVNRESTPVRFYGNDQSIMVQPESSSKEVSVQPDTHEKASGTPRVIYTDTGIGTHKTTFTDKETCTPQIHRMHKNISTESQTTADAQTATTDISATYRDLIAQEDIKSTCSRGTLTDPVTRKILVDKGSSPLKLVRTRDKATMVNKASFVESDEKFAKAGSLTNRLSDSMEGELHFVPSLESISESLKELSSDDDDSVSSGEMGTPPLTHKERLWNVTPNGKAKLVRESMFSTNAGVQSAFIKCCVETGTSTQNVSMEDKAISTESIVVDGKMAECISKLRTVRQRLENQPSSTGLAVSTLTSPQPIYSRANIMSSQPVTLPSTATVDVASQLHQSNSVTTVTHSYKRSMLVGDRVPSQPIPMPSSPVLSGLDSPSLRSKARKFKLNMTQMLSNSPSEEDSPPTPPTSKSKMRGPMYGHQVKEKRGLAAFRKERGPQGSPVSFSSPEDAQRAVSSPERLREKLEKLSVPELLQPFRTSKTGKPDKPLRSRLDRNRPKGGNFDDVKLGRGIIPVGGERKPRDSTPPPPMQRSGSPVGGRGVNKLQQATPVSMRPRLNPLNDLRESDV